MPLPPKDGLRNALHVLEGETVDPDLKVPNDFDSNRLLDALMTKMKLDNDEALAHKLQVIHPIVRMIREGKLEMSPAMLLLWVQEATGIKVGELQALMRNGKDAN